MQVQEKLRKPAETSRIAVIDSVVPKSTWRDLLPGVLASLSALPIAALIHLINDAFPDAPQQTVRVVGGLFTLLLALPPAIYLVVRRRSASAGELGLIVLATIGVLLVSIYIYWVSFYVLFPVDSFIWSESDFVNDIVKLRLGYPLYTAQQNNESSIYTPGAKMLTYLLAWLLGAPTSIPVYRIIQIGYTAMAAMIAVCCCRRLVEMSLPARRFHHRGLWSAVWLPILSLMATNSLTNPFVHNLHNDALAQLVSVAAYWLLLVYIATPGKYVLALMAIVPAAGFFVKQSLVIWALLYGAYLAICDRPRSMARLVSFTLTSLGGIGAVVAACYLLWGEHFTYWITVLGSNQVCPLRSFQHLMDGWAYAAIGLLGGCLLLRGRSFYLVGVWTIWLSVFLIGAYTSGIAWMRNHLGPGSLLAGIWFVAALVSIWPPDFSGAMARFQPAAWLRAGSVVAMVGLLFNGLGVIRIPLKPLSDDHYRYIREIEREFQGHSADTILLDAGSWIYLKDGVIMKDRVAAIGDRGLNGTGDFSGMIQRLEQKQYAKILIRNLHSPEFHYDHWMWRESSGIKQTLLTHYHEIGRIMGVSARSGQKDPRYLFSDISILVPNVD